MATINITTTGDRYSNYPTVASGDAFVLSDLASFIVDLSTVPLSKIEFNSIFQSVILENASTATPIIIELNSNGLVGNSGRLTLSGALLSVATADGTASQTIQFPADANSVYPSVLGYVFIGAIRYTQVSSFTGIRADIRGYHFLYNSGTGVMTFGDGVNGVIPTGAVTAENIYIESNGSAVNIRDGLILGNGHCVFVDSDFEDDPNMNVTNSWGIVNNSSQFEPFAFTKHKYGNLSYLGVGTGENVRVLLAEDTVGDSILFQTESGASSEVFQNVNTPMWGDHEIRAVGQRSSDSSRVRLYNNGGDATLKIFQGRGVIFTPYGGIGGKWHVIWSDGYLTTDLSPYSLLHGRYECDQEITFENVGVIDWSGERGAMTVYNLDAGKYKLGSALYPTILHADVRVDEIINTVGTVDLWADNLQFLGEASSGSRDFNFNSTKGTLITNFTAPNDTSHGNQPEPFIEFQFASFIGFDPYFSYGMDHSIVVKNAARDVGQLWFMPHAHTSNASMISGTVDDLIYTSNRVYMSAIGVKGEVVSNSIPYHGASTVLSIEGSNTSDFTFEYKLWEQNSTEPASYQPLSLANVQADEANLTINDNYYFKYTFEKTSGLANSGYLLGLYLEKPLDSSYVWEPDAVLLPITAPNFIDGTRVVTINYTRSTFFEGIIISPVLIDNSIISGGAGYSTGVRVGGSEVTQLGDIILIKANWQSGVSAKLPLRIFAVLTESGITIIDSQVDDDIHNNMIFNGVVGLDGSLVDSSNGGELTANLTDVEVNIDDDNDIFDCRRGIAWWRWVNTTEMGALIYDALGLVYKPDEYNIVLEGRLKIKNSKIGSRLQVINGIWTHYLGESILADDTETIRWVPNDRLYNSNESQITDIKAVVDAYLDAAISSRSTQTSVDAIDVASLATSAEVAALNDFDPSTDVVANVPLVGTVTTNTDMRGTDNALLASTYVAPDNTSVAFILADTNELQGNQGDWLTADVTGLVSIQSDIDEILVNHNNPTYYFGADGTTRVELPEAYYISLRSVDGLTEIRRINAVDSSNNPINFLQTTGYN